MTTATTPSAYPITVEALLPQAQQLADDLGDDLSQTKLMKTLKIGAPKAKALLALLDTTTATAATVPTLTLVPDLAPGTNDGEDDTPDPAPMTEGFPDVSPLVKGDTDPDPNITTPTPTKARSWPVWLLALPAFVAIWSGWVGLGELTGFGVVHPLPGIANSLSLNTAITLPIGVETYAAYALAVWLTGSAPAAARRFARWSAIGSLMFGAAGQVAYHLLTAAGVAHAPWQITTAVACLPVAVLGMGAALAHLVHANRHA